MTNKKIKSVLSRSCAVIGKFYLFSILALWLLSYGYKAYQGRADSNQKTSRMESRVDDKKSATRRKKGRKQKSNKPEIRSSKPTTEQYSVAIYDADAEKIRSINQKCDELERQYQVSQAFRTRHATTLARAKWRWEATVETVNMIISLKNFE